MIADRIYAVIIAGGRGTRFWPMSRSARPKHLLEFHGDSPLIRQTVDRILPLCGAERCLVVTTENHADELRRVLPDIPAENILVEPVGKNTAPAIALAAAHVMQRNASGIMAVFPADHIIEPRDKFLLDVEEGAHLADDRGVLTVFGIRPTRPETGYGYIEVGQKIDGRAFFVSSFREKPNQKKAKDYLGTGRYLWNGGMFVFRADVFMDRVKAFLPDLYAAWEKYRDSQKTADDLKRFYNGVEAVSIDYGIMEKCGGEAAVVNASFNWSDVGSWDATDDLWKADDNGNRNRGKGLVGLASQGNTVVSKKLVALLGVDNLIVVETDDALLVARKDRAQEIKAIVEELEKRGLKEFL